MRKYLLSPLLLAYLLIHGGVGDWSALARPQAASLCCVNTAVCCCTPGAQVKASGSCLMAAPCGGEETLQLALNKRVPHRVAPLVRLDSDCFWRALSPLPSRHFHSLLRSPPEPVPKFA